jgi:poly(hydroxyalkanoate) depolymerase family esterase
MAPIDWRELYASNRAVIEGGPRAPARARVPRPSGRSGTSSHGRHAVLHVPSGLDRETAAPLVCMLHGCTQDAAGFAAATRMNQVADRHGFVVVYPEQTAKENQQRCWNWFAPGHQARGAGEPSSIAAIVGDLPGPAGEQRIDRGRVFVAGLSAGGAMAAVLGATHPELFAAVAVHSGLAYRSAESVGSAFAAMSRGAGGAAVSRALPLPTMVVHGDADRTVNPVNAEHVLTQAIAADARFDVARPTTASREDPDGRRASTTTRWSDPEGRVIYERLIVEGMGHAWSGGAPGYAHTDAKGPDAAERIWRFFAGV